MKGTVQDVVRAGIQHCRNEDWKEGLKLLSLVAEHKTEASPQDPTKQLPGIFYSYLGYAMARVRREIKQGIALCEHAVKVEFFQPDNYLNLARTHLLVRNRRQAVAAVERGLAVDPHHQELRELQRKLGMRRRPTLPFLSRTHPANRVLGQLWDTLTSRSGR